MSLYGLPNTIGFLSEEQSAVIRRLEREITLWEECAELKKECIDRIRSGAGFDGLLDVTKALARLEADLSTLESDGFYGRASDRLGRPLITIGFLGSGAASWNLGLGPMGHEAQDPEERILNVLTALEQRIACLRSCSDLLVTRVQGRTAEGTGSTSPTTEPGNSVLDDLRHEFITEPDEIIRIIYARDGKILCRPGKQYCKAMLLESIRLGLGVECDASFMKVQIDFSGTSSKSQATSKVRTWYDRSKKRNHLNYLSYAGRRSASDSYHECYERAAVLQEEIRKQFT